VAFAFGLAASSFFPVILLGIFDKRTNRAGAICGMLAGIGFTGLYIIGNRFFGMPAFFFGISAQGIGAVGMVLNLVTTWTISRLTPPPPFEVQMMVESVRVPRGAGEASGH
jgi:cation/acetate symporter